MSLASNLNKAHASLISAFKTANKDKDFAERLEKFLNYVVYQKELEDTSKPDGFFTKALADYIRQRPEIIALFGRSGGYEGEHAFATMMLTILQYSISDIDVKEMVDQVIIGDQMATIATQGMLKKSSDKIKQNLQNSKSIREYTAWDARQGKIDIDMSEIQIIGKIKPEAQQLLQMTASVKNYSDFKIHLERVNVEKAYIAIMSEAYPRKTDVNSLKKLYNDYYQERSKQADAEITNHINHLINAYALTGYGQAYYTRGDAAAIEKKYAKFLMINNRAAQQIIIRSTGDIVLNEILKGSGSLNAGFAHRKTSSSTKYRDVIEVTYQV